MSPIDKLVNNLSKRLERYSPSNEFERHDRLIEARFAKLREERAKNSIYSGYKAYEDAWVNMTQEEIEYYRSKITPEERYQTMKEIYYFHDSSAYMKSGGNGPETHGCNSDECISECDFYLEYGRIEDDGTVTH